MYRKERLVWIMIIFIMLASTIPINLGCGGMPLFDHICNSLKMLFISIKRINKIV